LLFHKSDFSTNNAYYLKICHKIPYSFQEDFLLFCLISLENLFCKTDQTGILQFDNDELDLQKRYRYYY